MELDFISAAHDDHSDCESIESYEKRAVRVLDLTLLEVLRCHLHLAAIILPTINAIVAENGNTTSITDNDTVKDSHPQRTLPSASSLRSSTNRKTILSSRLRKRSRQSDSDEDPDESPQKRQLDSTKAADTKPTTFACHFYKRDPEKHGPLSKKFKNCIAPRVPELRRIKSVKCA